MLDSKAIVLNHSSYFTGPSGYPHNTYKIVNETEVIAGLNKDLKNILQERDHLRECLQVNNNKKWWQQWQ